MEKSPKSKDPKKEEIERIEVSAVLHEGSVYTGKRHGDAIRAAVEATGKKPVTGKQGFVTNTGRFVSREEAVKIALAAGQITEAKDKLFSEDLW